MDVNSISPYIRLASYSLIEGSWKLNERILFDYELIYIDQGCMSLTVEGVEHLCQEGTVILLRPNQPHIIKRAGDTLLSQPHIHFDLTFQEDSKDVYVCFENYAQLTEEQRKLIRTDALKELQLDLPTVMILKDVSFVRDLLYTIIDKWVERKPFYEMECNGYFLQILAYLFRNYNTQQEQGEQYDFSDSMNLSHLKNYILHNYHMNITLDGLAKQFGMSKFYLTRRFKEVYGKSAIEYLNSVRLERAKFFLKNQNLNITQVSSMVGFASVYVFSHFFKKKTGMSPLEYRKSKMEKKEGTL